MNITDKFINNIEELARKPIPDRVLERAKQSLLDYLAVCSAGDKANEYKLKEYFDFAQPEEGQSTLIGMKKKVGLKEAAFLNGLNGHTLDFDDGTNTGIIHLGSPIFSVLLPLAEKYHHSLDKVLRAAVIGYETSFTMAVSIQPLHKSLGYHATGTCGILGIAIAGSFLLDFTSEERRRAFDIAAISASGMLKVLDGKSQLKPLNVAKTSLLGLTALQLAKAGFEGNEDSLGGRGFIKMMTGKEDIELEQPLLNGTYAIEKTYTKPYAACRYTHPSIEAALNLRNKFNINDISEITVETYDLAVAGHDHTDILGSSSAKMSIPYSVAVALIEGKAGLIEYDEEHVSRQDIINLTKKVTVKAKKEYSDVFPVKQAACLTIGLTNGAIYKHEVDYPKGEPENPLNEKEFVERLQGLYEFAGYSASDVTSIINFVANLNNDTYNLCQLV